MKRNDSDPKHLATGKRPVCGYKAKAAIFAGMVALALVPVTAYAAPMPMYEQGEPQQMEQTFEAQKGQDAKTPATQGQQSFGAAMGKEMQKPEDGQAPALPDGMMPEDGQAPALPDGMMPEDGQAPALPDGQAPEDGQAPAIPDGQAPEDGQAPAIPDGQAPEDGQQAPALPDGQAPEDGQSPALPDGQAPEDGASEQPGQQGLMPADMPAEMGQGESTQKPCDFFEIILRKVMDFYGIKVDGSRAGSAFGSPSDQFAPRDDRAQNGTTAPDANMGQANPSESAAAPMNGEQAPAMPMGENAGQPSQQATQPGQASQGAPSGQSDSGIPSAPSGQPGQSDSGIPSAPSGQSDSGIPSAPSGQSDSGIPSAPSGQTGQPGQSNTGTQPGQPSQGAPSGESNTGTQPGQPSQGAPSGQSDSGSQSSASGSSSAATTLSDDASGQSFTSTTGGENAVLVSGKSVTLSNVTVNKTGNSSSEDADFYGTNAGVLATNGATLTIEDATIVTDGTHANAVFSYGSGTTVNISDSTITTSGNNSGGLMTTGGATLNATNLTVTTSGNSSAAIRSDRGGGTVTVSEGSYETSGVGSPAIYSTADITVSDATIAASNSEAVVIEGGNSVTLVNVDATGNNAKLNGQSTIATNVLIYQSMSGDASEGSSSFTMSGGSLTSLTGAMFHVTNVTTTINLTDVDLVNASDSSNFLIASADSWGTSGKNGGHATVNLTSQTVSGNITVDSVSSVTLNLQNSSYTGAIANSGTVKVTMDASSTWTLTGDSYITSLSGDTSGIDLNGYTLYVNGVAYSG